MEGKFVGVVGRVEVLWVEGPWVDEVGRVVTHVLEDDLDVSTLGDGVGRARDP